MVRADRKHIGEDMTALLHQVTGSNTHCAPCAWSALTGLSSDLWADKPMNDYDEHHALDKLRFEHGAPFYVDKMPDRLVGVALAAFREPGRWALTVEWDGDDELHAVAVAVDGSTRVFADNHVREPLPVETVIERDEVYRTAVVVSGFQLVPDVPLNNDANA